MPHYVNTVAIIFPLWKKSRAYRAEAPIKCAGMRCTWTIEVGELYTKHKPVASMYHNSLHPFCRTCIPFVEDEIDDAFDEYRLTPMYEQDVEAWKKKYGQS